MKSIALMILMGLTTAAYAQKADFSGFYEGVRVGRNDSDASGLQQLQRTSTYPGLVAGYSYVVNDNLWGVEAFADYHNKSTTGKDAGVGLKVGRIIGNSLIFGRVAVTGIWPSYRPQVGLGVEYKLDKHFALTANASYDQTTDDGIKRQNKNLALGLNYYFH